VVEKKKKKELIYLFIYFTDITYVEVKNYFNFINFYYCFEVRYDKRFSNFFKLKSYMPDNYVIFELKLCITYTIFFK